MQFVKLVKVVSLLVAAFCCFGFVSAGQVVEKGKVDTAVQVEGLRYGYRAGECFVMHSDRGTFAVSAANQFVRLAMDDLREGDAVQMDGVVKRIDSDDFGTVVSVEATSVVKQK